MTSHASPAVMPSNRPNQQLRSVRAEFAAINHAADEVLHLMEKFLDAGYDPDIAAHLTQITLDNVQEDQ